MSDDPDELMAENEAMHRNPPGALERIDYKLQYAIPALKIIGWIIVALLALILWRVWK